MHSNWVANQSIKRDDDSILIEDGASESLISDGQRANRSQSRLFAQQHKYILGEESKSRGQTQHTELISLGSEEPVAPVSGRASHLRQRKI
jgi:hypothetical protein